MAPSVLLTMLLMKPLMGYCFLWTQLDNVTSQGSFLLSVGQDLDFVSRNQGITIKLLKVDLDYTINERYRFFVPKIEEAKCYQNEEVICGRGRDVGMGSHPAATTSDNQIVTLNKVLFTIYIWSIFRNFTCVYDSSAVL